MRRYFLSDTEVEITSAGLNDPAHELLEHTSAPDNCDVRAGHGIKPVAVALTQVASAAGLVRLDAKANQHAPSPRFKNGAGRCQTP